MSVYIPGMKMPKNCGSCELVKSFTIDSELILYCPINGEAYCKERKGCPLIPVPVHGRLVDADALLKKMEDDVPVYVGFTGRRQGPYAFRRDTEVYTSICGAPTVIPADKEAET